MSSSKTRLTESLTDYAGRLKQSYNEMNTATFTGANDVIVVRQEDGALFSTPFYVHFGKKDILWAEGRRVHITVNGTEVPIQMLLAGTGEAYFPMSTDQSVKNNEDKFVENKPRPTNLNEYISAASWLKTRLMADSASDNDETEGQRPAEKTQKTKVKEQLVYFRNDDSENVSKISPVPFDSDVAEMDEQSEKMMIRPTLYMTSDQLEQLKLVDGINEIQYTIHTKATADTPAPIILSTIISSIFLWHYMDKIVVSDVDGTITRSDVRGQLMPWLGRAWTHDGVAALFRTIADHGYKLLYVSARAISQSDRTKCMLQGVIQNDVSLPTGPLLTNPTGLRTAFQVEVINKNPEEFKINYLSKVRSLFLSKRNMYPFYAGFGNKPTDVFTYRTMEILDDNIYIINSMGEVNADPLVKRPELYRSAYVDMQACVVDKFPMLIKSDNPLDEQQKPSSDQELPLEDLQLISFKDEPTG